MHASAWLPAVLGAAMVWLGAPGVAAADDLPPCDPATTPLAHLTGLTDQLVAGRDFKSPSLRTTCRIGRWGRTSP